MPARRSIIILAVLVLGAFMCGQAAAQAPIPFPKFTVGLDAAKKPQEVALSLQILFLMTIVSLAPSFLVLMTCFTRIVIVLAFVRNALGTMQMPPNQVIVGFALFLTFLVMAPIFKKINNEALQPYLKGTIPQTAAMDKGLKPLREFMLKQTREKDLALIIKVAKVKRPRTPDDVPTYCIIPAFCMSELKTAFEIGFAIYIPFIVIDMVIATTLMSMGMIMLPPMLISLPFKILLFVMVDGWHLVVRSLLYSFKV